MSRDHNGVTHYVGDDCPGGHEGAPDLEKLSELAERATKAPWEANLDSDHGDYTLWGPGPHEFIANIGTEVSFDLSADNARFIAAARTAVPALIARLRELQEMLEEADSATFRMSNKLEGQEKKIAAVKALHRSIGIYDECGHDHAEGQPGVIDADEVGLVCADGLLYTICYECDTDDGEMREDSEGGEYPCATLKALED